MNRKTKWGFGAACEYQSIKVSICNVSKIKPLQTWSQTLKKEKEKEENK